MESNGIVLTRSQFALCIFVLSAATVSCSKPTATSSSEQQPQQISTASLIGKWCFKPSSLRATWDLVEIRRNGTYSVVDHFGDGSTATHGLTGTPDALREDGSDTGDGFILPLDKGGELVVTDTNGEIGRATALPDTAASADCLQS